MKSYAIMLIEKIKNSGTMTSKYKHNCRKVDVENADKDLFDLNDELVTLPEFTTGKRVGEEMNYYEAFKKRLNDIPYYENHTIRKNAVLAYEIIMTFTKEASVDKEAWKEQSMDWLKQTFNKAGDGKSNILHAVCHEDEPGNIHIHAIVVPIDENCKLNASRYTDGFRALSEMQTSYAKAVENLGLERGLAGSSAKHKDIRKLYAELNRAKADIPQPKENETATQYYQRAMQELETMRLSIERERNKKAAEQRRKLDEYRIKLMDENYSKMQNLRQETERMINQQRSVAEAELDEVKLRKDKLVSEFNSINAAYDKIKSELGVSSAEELDNEYIKELIRKDNDYIEALNYFEENDLELYNKAVQAENQIDDIVQTYKDILKEHTSDGLMFDDFNEQQDLR